MEEGEKAQSKTAIAWVVLLLVAGPILWQFSPYSGISTPATRTKAVNNVKQLLIGCRAYAADHEGGVYPPSLEVLYPDYIDFEPILYAMDKNGNRLPVVYHPGFSDKDDPRPILIEYPIVYKGKRVVGFVGGQIQEIPVE